MKTFSASHPRVLSKEALGEAGGDDSVSSLLLSFIHRGKTTPQVQALVAHNIHNKRWCRLTPQDA